MTVVPQTRSARTVQQVLAAAAAMTFPALRRAVDDLPKGIRDLAGVHFGWWDTSGVPTSGNGSVGKEVRPALVLLSCKAAGGAPTAGVQAAVAVELVHNASLLHDDIIDGDRIRRGRPALWSQSGVPAAILAGDALFFLATQVLAQAPPPLGGQAGVDLLTAAMQKLIDGEYTDTLLQDRQTVSVAECAAMAQGKTRALIAASCALGALAAGADVEHVAHLRAFGAHVGAAFQLIDELLGIWGDPRRTGKPAYADLAARKKSLPVAAALAADGSAGQELCDLYASRRPLSTQDVERAADLVDRAGGRTWARAEADHHIQHALAHMHTGCSDTTTRNELTALTRLITDRDH
ncbi:polyprenyl synthetase family protein [Streptomyces sp. b94]|uniref:polyprenyl synthetase family protein n=1 Tax=Streptomyces sp. b94 TaxID=1827634 RepID=UPI001B38CA23|nr:polyprenyl synthetase family protein [Streptomyces sp. b94]MBQ1098001.1 polyprenyl synthetase family protein [Streptomyces sp. b94]